MSRHEEGPAQSLEERPRRERTTRPRQSDHEARLTPGPTSAAFDVALARTQAAFNGAAPADELERFLAEIRRSVRCVLEEGLPPARLPRSFLIERIIERVRREFIELLGARASVAYEDAILVLAALGKVQRALCTPAGRWHVFEHLETDRAALEFAIEIAHDVRSPLTAILFLVDMLRSGRGGPVTPAQARQLGIVFGAAFGLNQLATDLIDHARHERLIEPVPVDFSVTETMQSVRDILSPMTEERQLEMRLVTLEDDGRVGFPNSLHRILLNLATNALKYTSKGSVTVSARQLDGTRVEFAVADTGPGISKKVQARIFNTFGGEGNLRRAFSSSGLGLTICRDLVARLGSELRIASAPRRGSRFFFELELPFSNAR